MGYTLPTKATPVPGDMIIMKDSEDNDKAKTTLFSALVVKMTKLLWDSFGGGMPSSDTGWAVLGGDSAITGVETNGNIRMAKCTVTAIHGRAGSGSSNTTWTLRRDGVDTAITGTVTGAGVFRFTGSVEYADGEYLSISYSTSGGSSQTIRALGIEYQTGVA